MNNIVTKDSLKQMLEQSDEEKRARIIGRALVALFNRQTREEQASNDTRQFNNVGFSGADAKSGSLTAKYFLKHRRLEKWQIERWLKPSKNGYPRICKYAAQLNEVACEKAEQAV
mgnify:CR=1 FL=1